MNEEERMRQEERYFEGLKSRAQELGEPHAEIAVCLYEISENGYVHENQESVQEMRRLLLKRAEDRPDTLLKPLEEAVSVWIGDEAGQRIRRMTEQAADYPYAVGYMRRPFRTSDLSAHLTRILSQIVGQMWLQASDFSLHGYLTQRDYSSERTRAFYRISHTLPDLIAQKLDANEAGVESALRDIVLGENQTALLSREMIAGMLMSHRSDLHKMVGDLLVAARLQEGLRQSIVESMDFGTPEAFLYLLRLILDNGFVRYASIVRAAAVWTGVPFEADDQRVVTKMLERLYTALVDAQTRADWLDSSNAQEVYVSLFAQALVEEAELPGQVRRMMAGSEHYRKVAAQYVLSMSQHAEFKYASAVDVLCSGELDPELLHGMLTNYTYDYQVQWAVEETDEEEKPWLDSGPRKLEVQPMPGIEDKAERRRQFEAFAALLQNGPAKPVSGTSGALAFLSYAYDPSQVLRKMMALTAYDMDTEWTERLIGLAGSMSADNRHDLLKFFLMEPESEVQRGFIFDTLTDKNMRNRETALKRARTLKLNDSELQRVESVLKLKTGSLRQSAIALLLDQPQEALQGTLERLLDAKTELQRLAGLELLTELSSDAERAEDYEALLPLAAKVAHPTPKEEQLLQKLESPAERSLYTAEKGFGLYDAHTTEPWLLESSGPQADFDRLFSLDAERGEAFIRGLDERIHELRDTEYEVEYYAGAKEKLLLGAEFRPLSYNRAGAHHAALEQDYKRESVLDNYPLAEEWRTYLEESGLGPEERLALYMIAETKSFAGMLSDHYSEFAAHYDYQKMQRLPFLSEWREDYVSGLYPLETLRTFWKILDECRYPAAVSLLIGAFLEDSEPEVSYEAAASAMERLFAEFPADAPGKDRPAWLVMANDWMALVRRRVYDDASFKRSISLSFRFDQTRRSFDEQRGSSLDIRTLFKAHTIGLIGDNEIYKQLLGSEANYLLRNMTSSPPEELKRSEPLQKILRSVVDRLLEIELARGDLATEATPLTFSLLRIEGMEAFIRILVSLGGETFVRGYIYGYGDSLTKKESLSDLLKNCHPAKSDDAAKLAESLVGTGISEQRLLEAAMYAPQWIEIVAEYLDWPGLRSAAWYFHAHINESFSAEKETIVAHYSPITPQEFNDGAFDVQWFEEAYEAIGADRFKQLYDCAKYISGGSNHRRSQLFADAVLGRLKLDEIRAQVASKRGKDQLLAYSLIPLAKNREKDLRERYDYIQKFLLESRQFGAQRRASESAAGRIAFGNLARSAGYADATRLQWDMEAGKMDELLVHMQPTEIGDVRVKLTINDRGLPEIEAEKNGKPLKSIPSRLNKDGHVLRLKEIKTDLTEQHRRFVRELERSMETEAVFRVSELLKLHGNPVVSPLLDTLVFRLAEKPAEQPKLGYFRAEESALADIESGAGLPLQAEAELVVAHPVDLYASGQWSLFQRDLIERGLQPEQAQAQRQPFKQIFRELYLPNADEKAAVLSSSRYAGHQVQPSRTVALLRGRGWTVSYEEGLQKVDYGRNVIATLYAMADWFSPADTEAPTLEQIQFSDRRTHKPLPLADLPPVLFSEIMRDADLVVSMAHVGGVDPEASLTTIELRTAIVRESLDLLGTDNVRLDGSYARIDGTLGEYAVHLGSGIAYKQAAGALNIIPVHGGQRGRFFLPFLDEDPRTAEILSKIVLLAEDTKIKDPQILEQIRG